MLSLPTEVLYHLGYYLPAPDVNNLSVTCVTLSQVYIDDFWRRYYRMHHSPRPTNHARRNSLRAVDANIISAIYSHLDYDVVRLLHTESYNAPHIFKLILNAPKLSTKTIAVAHSKCGSALILDPRDHQNLSLNGARFLLTLSLSPTMQAVCEETCITRTDEVANFVYTPEAFARAIVCDAVNIFRAWPGQDTIDNFAQAIRWQARRIRACYPENYLNTTSLMAYIRAAGDIRGDFGPLGRELSPALCCDVVKLMYLAIDVDNYQLLLIFAHTYVAHLAPNITDKVWSKFEHQVLRDCQAPLQPTIDFMSAVYALRGDLLKDMPWATGQPGYNIHIRTYVEQMRRHLSNYAASVVRCNGMMLDPVKFAYGGVLRSLHSNHQYVLRTEDDYALVTVHAHEDLPDENMPGLCVTINGQEADEYLDDFYAKPFSTYIICNEWASEIQASLHIATTGTNNVTKLDPTINVL